MRAALRPTALIGTEPEYVLRHRGYDSDHARIPLQRAPHSPAQLLFSGAELQVPAPAFLHAEMLPDGARGKSQVDEERAEVPEPGADFIKAHFVHDFLHRI